MAKRWLVAWITWCLLSGLGGVSSVAQTSPPAANDDTVGVQPPLTPAVESAVEASRGKTPESYREPDRRWIIKGQSPKKSSSTTDASAARDLVWETAEQQHLCRDRLEALDDSFEKAQYYSIQGDSCRTAEESARFLGLVERCRAECPEGFLENNGLKPEVIRNLRVLKRLGNQRCPQK